MIKAKGTIDGRETLILGLSKENVNRLKASQPIHFYGDAIEIDHDVMILYGLDEKTLMEKIGVTPKEADRATRLDDTGRDVYLSRDRNDEPEPQWLIWSNEHAAWWRPGKWGYTRVIEEAGRYAQAAAEQIVADANRFLEPDQQHVNEMMVRAPEA